MSDNKKNSKGNGSSGQARNDSNSGRLNENKHRESGKAKNINLNDESGNRPDKNK